MSVFTPMLPSQGTNQGQGLNSVVYTPEFDNTFKKENLPAAKLVTLENNSSNVVYPIFYGANSTVDDQAGKVVRLTLVDPGLGYAPNPLNEPMGTTVEIKGGSGKGATAVVQVAGDGSLYGLVIQNGGTGYKPGEELTVEFHSNSGPTKVAKATAAVAQYDSNYALYDPKDTRNETYRGYVGEQDASGNFVLGLQPGHQATVQVPLAFWDGGRLYFATNGSVPLSTPQDPGNPLQDNSEWFYDPKAASFVVAPGKAGDPLTLYGANFPDPVTGVSNLDAMVMWYHKTGQPNDFGFGVPATLTEMTFRDPKQFEIAKDMLQREIDTIVNYDVSYVDSLAMPASMEGTNVPLRGAPNGSGPIAPGDFSWLGSDMSVSQMQQGIAKFTANDLSGAQVGVPGLNGLGTYFGGRGYDQYYMPPDNAPTRAITGIGNTPGSVIRITTNTAGLANGSKVTISGVTGQKAINGTWEITNVNPAGSFDLPSTIRGDGTPTNNGGTWTAQNTGVSIQKVPAGFQVITDGEVQNVQSSFDASKYNLVSGGTKANIATGGTGVATQGSTDITGVSYAAAIQLAPGMIWSPADKKGVTPATPFFPNGTTIGSIIPGTVGGKDWTIRMSAKANVGGSPGGTDNDNGPGGAFTFNGSQFTSETGNIQANGNQITGLDPKVGIYLHPGMLVTGPQIPPGIPPSASTQTFIQSISSDFTTITLTQSIGTTPSSGKYTFLGGPYSYIVQQLTNVWYAWADYYVKQTNSQGTNLAPTGSFAGTTRVNPGLATADDTLLPNAMDTVILDITNPQFDITKLRMGDVLTSAGSTLMANPTLNTPNYDPSLNYTIVGIDTKNRNVTLSRPVGVKTATADTYTFTPPQYIVRSQEAPIANGTAGTNPYTLDFSGATQAQKDNALKFSRTVYDVMQSFSLLLDPQTLVSRSALLLRYSIGGNVGSFVTNQLFAGQTGRNTLEPHERTHLQLRDEIKSILRGVYDFQDPNFSSPSTWYPAPATPTPGATLNGSSVGVGIYNLNPYVWFIHTQLNMSGYGFSLDDDVANTTANTNYIEVAFGGNVYTAPVNTTKTPSDPPAPDLANLEAYTGGAKFGTQQSQGFIQGSSKTPDFPGETRISGLNLESVLKLVASTNPSDPAGALITGMGLPPGVTVRHVTPLNPVNGVDQSWVTFQTPKSWTPPTQDQPLTQFTFSGFTTKLPDQIVPTVTSGAPGTIVTLTGTGYTGVLGVSFNCIPAALVSGEITGIVNPNGGMITINTTSAQGLVNGDTVTISGVTGQTSINRQWVITNVAGNSFQLSNSKGNGVASSGGEWLDGTDSSLKVFVPSFKPNSNGTTYPGPSGKIAVRTPSGTNYSAVYFTIGNSDIPTFSGIGQPGNTTAKGSLKSTVTLYGNGFTGTSTVTFDGSATPINSYSTNSTGTELKITIPVDSSGTGTFTIKVGGTTYTSTGFTFSVNQPVIASSNPFNPAIGPVGTIVTIKGTGFTGADDPDTGEVTINGTAATEVTVINDTTLTARVAPGTTSGKVQVTTSAGSGDSGTNQFTVSAFQAPTVTSATPNQGSIGARIQLTGTNFTGVNQTGGGITFGGVGATTFQVIDDQTIVVNVPTGVAVGSAPIIVTNPGSLNSAPFAFTVIAPTKPVITGFSPGAGQVGTQVTITGSGFTNSTLVQFNQISAGFVIKDDATIVAIVPDGATTGPISIKNGLGATTSSTNFVIGVQPTITSFSPDRGTSGTVVTLKGSGFNAVTSVKFNGVDATGFTVTGNDSMTATVPTGAKTGRITVSTSGSNAAASATDFTVTTSVKPTITNFSPTSGPAGASVTISGTGLTGATGVSFNGVAASTFKVMSDNSIQVTVPTLATTGLITVTNSTDSGSSQTNFTVSAPNSPAFIKVSSGSPQSNAINGVFDFPLKAMVTDSNGTPLSGISVTFTAPGTGASGKFAGGGATATVTTDASGIANSPLFLANGTTGTYTVQANVNPTLTTPASFTLTNLTGNQGYINSLFQVYLGRNGSPSDLNTWVAVLSKNGRAAVVNGIMRSTEASSRVVESLFVKLLGRSGGDQTAWIKKLVQGQRVEEVISGIVASQEFGNRAKTLFPSISSDAAYVNALFSLLMNRQGTTTEVNQLVNRIGLVGRDGVANDILTRDEFRSGAVRTFFGDPTLNPLPYQPFLANMLRRKSAPSMADVNGFVRSKSDLLSIQTTFAVSEEFYQLSLR